MNLRNSLVVQWLGLHAPTAGGTGLIPSWGTKILQTLWYSQKKKKIYIQNRNRLIDIENKLMVTKGEREGEKDK